MRTKDEGYEEDEEDEGQDEGYEEIAVSLLCCSAESLFSSSPSGETVTRCVLLF